MHDIEIRDSLIHEHQKRIAELEAERDRLRATLNMMAERIDGLVEQMQRLQALNKAATK